MVTLESTIGPALVEGERRLFEGNPILRHLARTHGLGRLMPSDPWGQAEVDSWLDFLVLRIGMSFVQGMPDAAFRYMAVIDRRLATNEWLCGAFTAADCGFITMADMSAKLPEDELPHLTAYLDRLVARPACGRARAAWTERRSQSVSREKSR
jgi:glutathione S-transferase